MRSNGRPAPRDAGDLAGSGDPIIAFAFACAPELGSEPGAGWNMAQVLARSRDVHVITRHEYRESLQKGVSLLPEEVAARLHFYFATGLSDVRTATRTGGLFRLNYLVWQISAWRLARRLAEKHPGAWLWHLTYANVWLGTTAALVGKPLVVGPVGGGVRVPWSLVRYLGMKGTIYELLRAAAQRMGRYLNPLARSTWRRADLILAQNEETANWFPQRYRTKVQIFHNAFLPETNGASCTRPQGNASSITLLFVGRLLPLKGVAISLAALEHLSDHYRLVIVGEGTDRKRLEQQTRRLNLQDRVTFRGRLSRSEVDAELVQADIFLFPSMHDEAGVAVAEAIGAGLPVVCLDIGGPPVIAAKAGIAVCPKPVATLPVRLADAIGQVREVSLPREARVRFSIEHRTEVLQELLSVISDRESRVEQGPK